MNILDRPRSRNVLDVEKPSITPDPKCVLIVGDGRIRRRDFSGWAGVHAAADAMQCIVRREGSVLLLIMMEPWRAAEYWGQA